MARFKKLQLTNPLQVHMKQSRVFDSCVQRQILRWCHFMNIDIFQYVTKFTKLYNNSVFSYEHLLCLVCSTSVT